MNDATADDDDCDVGTRVQSCMPSAEQMHDQAEYYKLRLEHTLQHTQQGTRLIYLANGGVLAALYFVAEKLSNNRYATLAEVGLLLLLSVMNLIHCFMIVRQGKWYREIDIALADVVGAKRIAIKGRWGTHRLYVSLHFVLAIALLSAGLFVFIGMLGLRLM
jgi:hypothetical protein